jgi:hypothetical protein
VSFILLIDGILHMDQLTSLSLTEICLGGLSS